MFFKVLGQHPKGQRLERIEKSPNFRNGTFQNIHPTSMSKEGGSMLKTMYEFATTDRPADLRPSKPVSGIKIDLLKKIEDQIPVVIWFGHSSYLIKFRGKNILVDPVFSGHAAPVSSMVQAFPGTDLYRVEDMPEIDLLILTHDHYDHIDFKSVTLLKEKTKYTVCSLGVGEHLEYWNFLPEKFTELDWWQCYDFSTDIRITATPARHFSGRGITRNKTQWCSYVLELAEHKIFIGGDSGYDDQFKKIGEKFKKFDLALLECGQYGINWPYIHMFPEQTVQAAKDLNAHLLMPVHWGKFVLSVHSWTEPIERALIKAQEINQKLTTPKIGEAFKITQNPAPNSFWWRD